MDHEEAAQAEMDRLNEILLKLEADEKSASERVEQILG
jgi:hypothetical protein